MSAIKAPSLAERLAASVRIIDVVETTLDDEPALDLQIALERVGAELLKISGALQARFVAGEVVAHPQSLARARKAAEQLCDALSTYAERVL